MAKAKRLYQMVPVSFLLKVTGSGTAEHARTVARQKVKAAKLPLILLPEIPDDDGIDVKPVEDVQEWTTEDQQHEDAKLARRAAKAEREKAAKKKPAKKTTTTKRGRK